MAGDSGLPQFQPRTLHSWYLDSLEQPVASGFGQGRFAEHCFRLVYGCFRLVYALLLPQEPLLHHALSNLIELLNFMAVLAPRLVVFGGILLPHH